MKAAPAAPAAKAAAPEFDVRRAVLVAVSAGLVAAVTAAAAWLGNGDVPRGARVLGVSLGGESRAQAEEALAGPATASDDDPVLVRLGGRDVRFDPAAVGVRVDVDLSVGRAIRGPVLVRGHRDVPPVVDVNRAELSAALSAAAAGVGCGPGGRVVAYGKCDFDLRSAVRLIKQDWPRHEVAVVPLEPAGADLDHLGGEVIPSR